MTSAALEILGLGLGILGWVGVILACGLPMWQVSAFIDVNIVVAQTIWEGLWMNCVVQSTGQMQCKVYDSILALKPEVHQLHPARQDEIPHRDRRRGHLHPLRDPGPRPALLVRQHCHQRLLRPLRAAIPEAGDGGRALHWLGGHGPAALRGLPHLLLLLLTARRDLLPRQVLGTAAAHLQRRVRQEELRLSGAARL
uniref:Claudin n=1 Tax=Anas platyrhynchos platyrhynchos TaxID=8840 RepID=A0A493TU96_ANAPP